MGMKGVRYLVDDNGHRTAVVIDLRRHRQLWEDFYDRALAEARRREPRESLESVRGRLAKRTGRRGRG
jgi:hypothetical protein